MSDDPQDIYIEKYDVYAREIPEFDGYFCSRDARFFSTTYGDFRELTVGKNKPTVYHKIYIGKDRRRRSQLVHIMVAKTYIPNPSPETHTTVNHKDGNKCNNHVDNLEWLDRSGQILHAYRTGLLKHYSRPIIKADFEGNVIAEYESLEQASQESGIYTTTIYKVCRGQLRHCGGFVWHYKDEFTGQPIRRMRKGKPVWQYSKDGEFIAEYPTAASAAEAVGCFASNLAACCNGLQTTTKGFRWQWAPPKTVAPESDPYADWICLDEFPDYKISKTGELYSKIMKRLLLPASKNKRMYYYIFNKNKKRMNITRYRLVALAYIPNPNNLPVVNHIDGNPTNDVVENLEWCSHQHNILHAYDTGLNKWRKEVIQYTLDGRTELTRFPSIKAAAASVGVIPASLSQCLNGKSKTCGGFVWKRVQDVEIIIPAPVRRKGV